MVRSSDRACPWRGSAVTACLFCFLVPLAFGLEEGAVWTASELAGDGIAGFEDGDGSVARFTFSAGLAGAPYLSGIAFAEDERSIYVVDSWNQAIREVEVDNRRVRTLVQAQPRDQPVGSIQDFALSGLATFGSFIVFSNNWNSDTNSLSDPRLEFYDTQFGGRSRVDTASLLGSGPEGIAVVADNQMVYSQRQGGLWQLNFNTREHEHKAGPELIGDLPFTKGFNDGVGTAGQMSSPAGMSPSSDGRMVYFVDTSRCNVRRLEVATNEVTTVAGARSGTTSDGICSWRDGDATTARFKRPIDCALLPNDEDLLVTEASHTLRLVNVLTGAVTTLAGTVDQPGLRNGKAAGVQFDSPSGVAAVADKIAVVDSGNQMVRLLRKDCLPYFILVLGTCRACETPLCPLGSFRAPCTETVVDGLCRECLAGKPESSEWNEGVQDCSWSCVATHERTLDGTACQFKPVLETSSGLSDEAIVALVAAGCAVLLLVTAGVLYYLRDRDLGKYFQRKPKPAKLTPKAMEDSRPPSPPPPPVQMSEAAAAGVGAPPPVDPMVAALNASGFDASPFQQQAFGRGEM